MLENIFDDIKETDDLERAIRFIFEGKSWEYIAKALYQILDDIDTASDMCKDNLQAFQDMVMKLQAKKNQYLQSPDGYKLEAMVDIDSDSEESPDGGMLPSKDGLMQFNVTVAESKLNETIADRIWDFLRENPDSTYNEILDGIDATGEDAGKFEGVIDDMLNKSIYVEDGKYHVVESVEVDPERLEEWIVEVIQEVTDAIETGELEKDKFAVLEYLKTNYKANNPEKAYEEMEQAVYDWFLTNMRESLSENLCAFAKRELDIAGLLDKDSDYEGMLGKAVMELMQTFSKQGHSGASAALTVDIFDKLASWKPLTELTDNPDEWQKVSDWYGGPEKDLVGMEYQSKRSPSCFSSDGGKTYYDVDENPNSKEKIMHKSKHFEKEE
jgi:hypothetical protein